jgi:hypothetical protein
LAQGGEVRRTRLPLADPPVDWLYDLEGLPRNAHFRAHGPLSMAFIQHRVIPIDVA